MLNNFPFTKNDVINALKNYFTESVYVREYLVGGKHSYFYVAIGNEKFQDNGKFTYAYDFAQEVMKQFKAIERELEEENIVYVRKNVWFESGYDRLWRCPSSDEIEFVDKVVKVAPSGGFLELQKWLKKKANFDLKTTDLYSCDICKKRSRISCSGYYYLAKNDVNCRRMADNLKAAYKQGYRVSVEIVVIDDIDECPSRYEYEQYGTRNSKLVVRMETAKGNKKQCFSF